MAKSDVQALDMAGTAQGPRYSSLSVSIVLSKCSFAIHVCAYCLCEGEISTLGVKTHRLFLSFSAENDLIYTPDKKQANYCVAPAKSPGTGLSCHNRCHVRHASKRRLTFCKCAVMPSDLDPGFQCFMYCASQCAYATILS